ncbi:MAG: GBS Bsp-like repeat-containing protein [Lachnospiraceae bacterium]|nr:GBS Bsp-like repeat-containing protein [Lachnospiraceae bacterium]
MRHSRYVSLLLSAALLVGQTGLTYAEEVQSLSETVAESTGEESGAEAGVEMAPAAEDEEISPDTSADSAADSSSDSLSPEEDAASEEEVPAVLDLEEKTAQVSLQTEDHGDGTIDLALKEYVKGQDVSCVYYAVWSQVNGQDDIKWYRADENQNYTMNIRDHKRDLGQYIVHVYEMSNTGSMSLVCADTMEVTSFKTEEPVLSASDVKGDEMAFRVLLENYQKPADFNALRIAVWSKEKGQDDIAWYTLKEAADGSFTCDVKPAKHKHTGEYYVHAYQESTSGKMTYVGNTGFTVTAPTAEIVVDSIDSAKGTCKVTVKGIKSPSGVTMVQIPVWSAADQSDIFWYQAEKVAEDTYEAVISISKHKYNIGPFIIHAYVSTGNGFTSYVGNSSVKFEMGAPVVTAEKKDGKYLLSTANIAIQGTVKGVTYAVWSEKNGQDDLKWYEGTYTASSRSAQYLMSLGDFKDSGRYQVHCYARMSDGTMSFLGNTDFEVAEMEIPKTAIKADSTTGDFTITVRGLKSESGISKVQVPVWSKSNQSDIVWYDAKLNESGDYVVKSNISKHSYNSGTYQVHVYVTEKNGMCTNVARDTFSITLAAPVIKVTGGADQINYTAEAGGVKLSGGVNGMQFAVWSQKNGQDDIKWYSATKVSEGCYKASVNIKNHKTAGLYYVHAYAENQSGKMVNVGTTEFTVNTTSSAALSFSDSGNNDGFTVRVTLSGVTCAPSKIKLPVWSKADQSDIYWYTATPSKNGDGTYSASVKVNPVNHKMNVGKFTAHCYTVYSNGIEGFSGGGSHTYNPPCVIGIENTGSGTRRAVLKYASSASGVKFAVWSETNGQDDIKWYSASQKSDGSWSATIKAANHKSSGKYQVHCYDGSNRFLGAATFSFAASEMAKRGWYYENGYKFYYQDGKKLTNLTSIIGAQSSYVAKVNRATCTITIYANDPASSKGYIIPVIAFTCSVGLPATPTTPGTHYTFAKYRWKELMGPSWGQYATKFTADGIYFHSVAGINTTSYNLNYIDYNNLGIPASHGCVRLCVRDAKWIYDNCPLGMKVIVYDSGDPGPYGKPATIKIPAGQTWDPTDPNI